jgi:hypothetical protein
MYEKRRNALIDLIQKKHLTGIEIGALDRPLVVRSELPVGSEIFYADHLSAEKLRSKYKLDSSVDLDNITDVDFISQTGDFSDSLQGRLVDYIVASHVVEHVPNPIGWFQMLFQNLRPGGFIFLVVPDKRFTFDYQRPVTTFGTMLQSFIFKKKIPSVGDVFDHHSSALMVDGGKIWSGLLKNSDLVPLTSNDKALRYAREVYDCDTYHDVHVSIFTPSSFFAVLERMIDTRLFMPEVMYFRDTDINDIEFFIALKKPELDEKDTRTVCLASIPSLPIETLVAPYMPQVKSLSNSLEQVTIAHQEFQKSYSKLESKIESQNEELSSLKEQINLSQRVLNRRSIKIIMKLTHIFFGVLSFLRSKRG